MSSFVPTYLYVKEHSITGLRYFGKTTKKDPYKYNGSGKYWTNHYKKYGKDHIKTLWVSELFTDKDSLIEFALLASDHWNIVDSDDWANLKPENGLDGWINNASHSNETKQRMSASAKGKIMSEETREKLSKANTGKTRSDETKQRMSESHKGKTISDETRAKMSAARKGRKLSDEHKAKISAGGKGKHSSSIQIADELEEIPETMSALAHI